MKILRYKALVSFSRVDKDLCMSVSNTHATEIEKTNKDVSKQPLNS